MSFVTGWPTVNPTVLACSLAGRHTSGSWQAGGEDRKDVARDIIRRALDSGADVLIIDVAGRGSDYGLRPGDPELVFDVSCEAAALKVHEFGNDQTAPRRFVVVDDADVIAQDPEAEGLVRELDRLLHMGRSLSTTVVLSGEQPVVQWATQIGGKVARLTGEDGLVRVFGAEVQELQVTAIPVQDVREAFERARAE